MSVPRYLSHITLTTGHVRRSWRHEIDPALMDPLCDLVHTALQEAGAPIPGMQPPLRLYITATARCALCSVRTADSTPVITFAVADHSRCGAQLWRMLRETADGPAVERPETPWCAVRLEAGMVLLSEDSIGALGDLERCVAWAWLETQR